MKNKKLFAARLVFTLLSVLTVGWIFLNSAMTAEESSSMSGSVRGFINQILESIGAPFLLTEHIVRKLAHFTEYAVLGALLSVTVYLYVQKRLRSFLLTLPIGLAVTVIDEFIQTLSEGRSCQVTDMLIDFSGVLLAALFVQFVLFLIYRHKIKKEGNEIERSDSE